MGDHFQTVVAPSIPETDAPALAAAVLEWLIAEEIITADKSDCVLGADAGHRPGQHSTRATGSVEVDDRLATNGVEVSTERHVFDAGQDAFGLICPGCGVKCDEGLDGWSEAVGEWFEGESEGLLTCPSCDAERPITAWTFDPVWAFGSLGFTFWNWPQLADDFLRELENRVGAPVVVVEGKL